MGRKGRTLSRKQKLRDNVALPQNENSPATFIGSMDNGSNPGSRSQSKFRKASKTLKGYNSTHSERDATSIIKLNKVINSSSAGEEISEQDSVSGSFSDDESSEHIQNRDDDNLAARSPLSFHDDWSRNANTAQHHLRGVRDVLSAYDYVYCPIPENRAYEVANSRLITRDLNDPGYLSKGLRVEDLVNLPPPHCRTPGTWTMWKKRIPLGPYEVFKLFTSSLLDKALGKKRPLMQQPLTPAHVTSRSECRHYRHKRASKRNTQMRVTKPVYARKLSLRGGGPRYHQPHDASPTRLAGPRSSVARGSDAENRRPGPSAISELTDYSDATRESTHSQSGPAPDRRPLAELPSTRDQVAESEETSTSTNEQAADPNSLITCHPCPIYEGQFHHMCGRGCKGVRLRIEIIDNGLGDDLELFSGSLWEVFESGELRRRPDASSLEDFTAQYRWNVGDGRQRDFMLSNGAHIRVSRIYGPHLSVEIQAAPHAAWRPFTARMGSYPRLIGLPDNYIDVDWRDIGAQQWQVFEQPTVEHDLDTFLSARWRNGVEFRFNRDEEEQPVRARLERLNGPNLWERLLLQEGDVSPDILEGGVIANTASDAQSSRIPHVRDFDAPDPEAVTADETQQEFGQDQINVLHEKLRRRKADREQAKLLETQQAIFPVPDHLSNLAQDNQLHAFDPAQRAPSFQVPYGGVPYGGFPVAPPNYGGTGMGLVFASAADVIPQIPTSAPGSRRVEQNPQLDPASTPTPAQRLRPVSRQSSVQSQIPVEIEDDDEVADSQADALTDASADESPVVVITKTKKAAPASKKDLKKDDTKKATKQEKKKKTRGDDKPTNPPHGRNRSHSSSEDDGPGDNQGATTAAPPAPTVRITRAKARKEAEAANQGDVKVQGNDKGKGKGKAKATRTKDVSKTETATKNEKRAAAAADDESEDDLHVKQEEESPAPPPKKAKTAKGVRKEKTVSKVGKKLRAV